MKALKALSLVFVFLLLLSISLSPILVLSAQTPLRVEKIMLAAVTGNKTGIIIPTTIEVFPGNGNIQIIDQGGKVSKSTISSIKYALSIASIISGRDTSSYDYKIIFPEDTDISGTSATLPFTVVFSAILTNTPIRHDYSATGILMPNGIVGNVSGIYLKYNAAVLNNIELFIGPYIKNIPGTKYFPVISAYKAYDLVTKTSLLGKTNNIVIPSSIDFQNYFINATKEFQNLTENILSITPTAYEGLAWKFYRLSIKYSGMDDWYTAASYGFRSYMEALVGHSLYLQEKKPNMYKEWVKKLESWYLGNLTLAKKNMYRLGNYTYQHLNIWNIDLFVNTFIRYSIALSSYQLFRATHSITQLIFALTRIMTAKQWGSIDTISSRTITYNKLLQTYKTLYRYTNTAINYFVSMKYISNTTSSILKSIEHGGNDLLKLAKLIYIQYLLTDNLLSLQPPVFAPYLTPDYILGLNKTVSRLANYLLYMSGTPVLSAMTTVDVARAYAVEMENITVIDSLLVSELTLLTMYKAFFITPVYSPLQQHGGSEINFETQVVTSTPAYEVLFYAIAIILISLGAFLAGFSIRKYLG
ncbi:MAG: hypothetical protein GXO43_01385 [Crenarchaeota archaeon]|nr:hypothetical protein [Thermoproteota archaeon]